MAAQPTTREQLSTALRELASIAPRDRTELRELVGRCVELARHLQRSTLANEIDESIWHFLSDADIRFKDPAYAQGQLSTLNALLDNWDGVR